MMADEVRSVLRIEILLPQLPVGHFVTQDKVGRFQNTVRDHAGRSFLAFPTGKPTRLLLDSRIVDVPMSYNPIVITPPSWNTLFLNGLQNGLRFSDHGGA